MKRRMKLTAVVLALVLAVSLMPAAGAAKVVDPAKDTGSVTLTLKGKGMEATLYRVGLGKVENSNLVFGLQDALAEKVGDLELNGLKAAGVEAVVEKLTAKDVKLDELLSEDDIWVAVANEKDGDGYTARLEDMPVGVYLVVQTRNRSEYEDFDPFLLYLPASDDGSWDSNVKADPKAEYSTSGDDDDDPPGPPPEDIPDKPTPKDPGDPPGDPPEEIPEEEVPLATLPQTGLLQWPIPVMAMAGLVLFVVGLASEKRRKVQE